MKPSEYIRFAGRMKDSEQLRRILFAYEQENADDVEQLKAITPKDKMSEETMRRINEYEIEIRIGNEALINWKENA